MQDAAAAPQKQTDQVCINTIRTLAMDAVQKASSGHLRTPMALRAEFVGEERHRRRLAKIAALERCYAGGTTASPARKKERIRGGSQSRQ